MNGRGTLSMSNFNFLDASMLGRFLDYPSLIAAIADGFAADWQVPLRHRHTIEKASNPDEAQTLLLMPAWDGEKSIGVKIVTVSPSNGRRNLPAVQSLYVFLDGATGEVRGLLDGETLTKRRTAAASALASRYLSRADSGIFLMVGAGALARPLIEAHASVRPLSRFLLWARDETRGESKARELNEAGMKIEFVRDLEEAARIADIISCATLAREPLIKGAWLKKGAHLDLVGAFTPEMREADNDAVQRARLFCDTREGALKEGGDLVQPLRDRLISLADIEADLRDLVQGRHGGRKNADDITLFKSVGHAIEDLAAAQLAMSRL